MSDKLISIMAAFEAAETSAQYNAAKKRAERELDVIAQMALVDTMIDAHTRLSGKGVRK